MSCDDFYEGQGRLDGAACHYTTEVAALPSLSPFHPTMWPDGLLVLVLLVPVLSLKSFFSAVIVLFLQPWLQSLL